MTVLLEIDKDLPPITMPAKKAAAPTKVTDVHSTSYSRSPRPKKKQYTASSSQIKELLVEWEEVYSGTADFYQQTGGSTNRVEASVAGIIRGALGQDQPITFLAERIDYLTRLRAELKEIVSDIAEATLKGTK